MVAQKYVHSYLDLVNVRKQYRESIEVTEIIAARRTRQAKALVQRGFASRGRAEEMKHPMLYLLDSMLFGHIFAHCC
jgi:hypothetical protein